MNFSVVLTIKSVLRRSSRSLEPSRCGQWLRNLVIFKNTEVSNVGDTSRSKRSVATRRQIPVKWMVRFDRQRPLLSSCNLADSFEPIGRNETDLAAFLGRQCPSALSLWVSQKNFPSAERQLTWDS